MNFFCIIKPFVTYILNLFKTMKVSFWGTYFYLSKNNTCSNLHVYQTNIFLKDNSINIACVKIRKTDHFASTKFFIKYCRLCLAQLPAQRVCASIIYFSPGSCQQRRCGVVASARSRRHAGRGFESPSCAFFPFLFRFGYLFVQFAGNFRTSPRKTRERKKKSLSMAVFLRKNGHLCDYI